MVIGWLKYRTDQEGRVGINYNRPRSDEQLPPCGDSNGEGGTETRELSWKQFTKPQEKEEGESNIQLLSRKKCPSSPPFPALEEECNFFTAKGRALPPFVALYFAECPVRVTDKGLCEGKMQPERNSNNEDG